MRPRRAGEGRVFVGDRRRDAGGKGGRGRDDFGVRRIGDHAVARGEARDVAGSEHLADVAVAQRDRLRELAPDRDDGGEEPLGADFRKYRAEFLRLLAGLTQPAAATELDQHPFRAERDQRARRADEQTAVTRTGRRDVEELGATRAQMLDDLAQSQERLLASSAAD